MECLSYSSVSSVSRTSSGLINGLFGAGAALGALAAPLLFNRRGRKPTMAWGAVFFTIGAALQMSAVSMPMLYIPRLLSGGGSEFCVSMRVMRISCVHCALTLTILCNSLQLGC